MNKSMKKENFFKVKKLTVTAVCFALCISLVSNPSYAGKKSTFDKDDNDDDQEMLIELTQVGDSSGIVDIGNINIAPAPIEATTSADKAKKKSALKRIFNMFSSWKNNSYKKISDNDGVQLIDSADDDASIVAVPQVAVAAVKVAQQVAQPAQLSQIAKQVVCAQVPAQVVAPIIVKAKAKEKSFAEKMNDQAKFTKAIRDKDFKAIVKSVQKNNVDINLGIDPITKKETGRPPIVEAARVGNYLAIGYLLTKKGIRPFEKDQRTGSSAYHFAAQNQKIKTIETLYLGVAAEGVTDEMVNEAFNAPNGVTGYTPLIYAIRSARAPIVTAGKSATEIADLKARREAGALTTIKQLFAEGNVNVNGRDAKNGSTALAFAVSNNLIDVAKFLIENGADKNAVNKSGKKVIDFAKSAEMKKLLK